MSLIRSLTERRMPQYLATYAGVAFGIIQFVDFLQSRYGLSPHWTTFTLIFLALLVPSVVLFTYHHGKPGKDEFVKAEKIGIPLNLIGAAVVLYSIFGGRDLRAVSAPITVLNEEGKPVERMVARSSYTKSFALFNFDGPGTDTATAWLRYALPLGLWMDLGQDMFVDARISFAFREKLRQAGFKDEVNVPLSLKRKLAEEQNLEYFSEGKVSRAGEQISVDLALYEVATGKPLKRHTITGTDPFTIIDQLTEAIKDDLEIPETKDVRDLPVSEVLTASVPAFRDFSEGMTAFFVTDQYPVSVQELERAAAADETFAAAQLWLHNLYLITNQTAKSMPPLEKAMSNLYRLPERMQNEVKVEYYILKQEKDKAYSIAKMNVELFPGDIRPHQLLLGLQQTRNDRAGMIETMKALIELDPSQQEYIRLLGSLYQSQGDFKNALAQYAKYAERSPSRPESFLSMGTMYRLQGDHVKARENFDKALTLEPSHVGAMISLGSLSTDLGEFDAALKHYNDALAAARTADDRGRALKAIADYYELRGELRRSISYFDQMMVEFRKTSPPVALAQIELSEVGTHVKAGRVDLARQTIDRWSKQLQPPMDFFISVGQMQLAIEQKQPDAAEAAVTSLEKAIATMGFEALKPLATVARAQIAELRGQCDEAIKAWQLKGKLDPTDSSIHMHIARCYRMLNQPQKAIEQAQMTLKVRPANGRANYELALAYHAAGDREKALESLRRAVLAWSNADANYQLAGEAKSKLRELEAGGSR